MFIACETESGWKYLYSDRGFWELSSDNLTLLSDFSWHKAGYGLVNNLKRFLGLAVFKEVKTIRSYVLTKNEFQLIDEVIVKNTPVGETDYISNCEHSLALLQLQTEAVLAHYQMKLNHLQAISAQDQTYIPKHERINQKQVNSQIKNLEKAIFWLKHFSSFTVSP
jgi:hypothetical protein